MKKVKWLLILAVFSMVFSCSSDGDNDPDPDPDPGNGTPTQFDRGAMLAHWSDQIIIPAYRTFLEDHGELEVVFSEFAASPGTSQLEALRLKWQATYESWQQISLFEIGPADIDGLRLNVNTYPANSGLIESNIAGGNYDLGLPSNRDAKGFPALDYLFNGIGVDDDEILNTFVSEPAYLDYAEALIEDIGQRVGAVLAEWEGGYRDTFVANDGSSATASVDRFVNDFIFYYEKFLRAGKMGIPLGVFTGTPAPTTIEAYYTPGLSNVLFLEGLDAVQDFFNGVPHGGGSAGPSLASYLQDLNTLKEGEALDRRINEQMNAARTLVSGLDAFHSEIEDANPPTAMLIAYDEVQGAVPLFKVDMVSAMSIAIDFVDADGD